MFYKITSDDISLVEPDICKTYAHAISLLCWTVSAMLCSLLPMY